MSWQWPETAATAKEVLSRARKGEISIGSKTAEQYSLLKAAAHYGLLEEVRWLLEAGEDINSTDYWGFTPLVDACIQNHLPVVLELIDVGARVNVVTSGCETPLIRVCHTLSLPIVNALLRAGTEVNVMDDMGSTPLIRATWYPMVNDVVREAQPMLIQRLLAAGADLVPPAQQFSEDNDY